jgi:hypothetical protein
MSMPAAISCAFVESDIDQNFDQKGTKERPVQDALTFVLGTTAIATSCCRSIRFGPLE